MQELSGQLRQDIEEACKKAGLTTHAEDMAKMMAVLALLGWVWYKVKKAGKKRDDIDE